MGLFSLSGFTAVGLGMAYIHDHKSPEEPVEQFNTVPSSRDSAGDRIRSAEADVSARIERALYTLGGF